MEKIITILEDIKPGIDTTSNKLVTDRHLDSLAILSLIAELEDEYGVMIPAVEINPDNFNSVESIFLMVNRLLAED